MHKIVHYCKTERLSECFMFHMKDFITEFNCYELFYVKRLFLNTFSKQNCFCLEMKGVTVDQFDAVVEENLFEKESSSKSSWKFCNQTTLPRSEVVFFVQLFFVLVLISLCIVKLTIFKPNCEETSVRISILSSLWGYILPTPILWIKLYLRKVGSQWPL